MAQARVLAKSFLRHHPDGRFTVLVIDAEDSASLPPETGIELAAPTEVGIERDELERMALIYDVMELATAVKPFFLRHLVETTGEPAVYFDPDIEVFADLGDIGKLASEH